MRTKKDERYKASYRVELAVESFRVGRIFSTQQVADRAGMVHQQNALYHLRSLEAVGKVVKAGRGEWKRP